MIPGKIYALLISALFFHHLLSAQHTTSEVKTDTVYYCDQKIQSVILTNTRSLYHGQVRFFYKNEKTSITKEYSHGLLNGKTIYFSEKGDTVFVMKWKDNVLDGQSVAYYPNNHKMFSENYYAGKLQGNSVYLDSTGKLFEGPFNQFYNIGPAYYSRTTNCIAGRPQGNVLLYNGETGDLLKLMQFSDGRVSGKSFTYRQDSIISISSYDNGKYVKEDDLHYGYHIFIYNNFIKSEPDNDHFIFLRGLAYLRIGKVKNCLDDLEKAIDLNKDNYKAYYNRAVILADSLPKSAMKDLMQTLKIKNDFYLAYYNLGILNYRDGQYKKARDNFENCIRLMPHHLPSIHNLSNIYGLLGDNNMQEYYKNEFERIRKKDKPKYK